jgi:DNA mismatch repair protein MutS2
MGLPQPILARAEELIGQREIRLSKLAGELLEQRSRLEAQEQKLASKSLSIEQSELEARKRSELLDQKERELLAKSHADLIKEVSEARRKVAAIIGDLQGIAPPREEMKTVVEKSKELKRLEREIIEQTEKEEAQAPLKPEAVALQPEKLETGAEVFIPALASIGEIIEVDEKRQRAFVNVRGKKVETRTYELRKIPSNKELVALHREQAKAISVQAGSLESPCNTLDIRGLHFDEAESLIEEFLDAAYGGEVPMVIIIHGHGTGALKIFTRQLLRDSRYIKQFRAGKTEEGGDGVTVAIIQN